MLNGVNLFFLTLGIFFVLPCIESYQKVDLRTITLGVPPQEVRNTFLTKLPTFNLILFEFSIFICKKKINRNDILLPKLF